MTGVISRRGLLGSMVAGAAGLLSGCDGLARNERFRHALFSAENMHKWLQRSLQGRDALAREFRPEQRSPFFRGNGTLNPASESYRTLWRGGFADWRLCIEGLVTRPMSLGLAQLQAMPSRVQTTRHDCVEGWSAIGTWRGVPLSQLLNLAGLSTNARFIVFHCLDEMGGDAATTYYESIDLVDAFHPQTILAYALNDRPLEVRNGAPLRLRAEKHLGYKQAKFLSRIEAVSDLSTIRGGNGGYWEDAAGYQWYAGI